MHLLRVVRVLLPLAAVLLVVAAVTSVLSARPDLQHAEHAVGTAWAPLGRQLEGRYLVLTAADQKVAALSGPVHELAMQLDDALTAWNGAHRHGDVAAQVRAANTLEALGRRLVTAALGSDRVKRDAAAMSAVTRYAQNASPGAASDFNKAVQTYERERRGPLRGVVATFLGQDDVPAFAPAVTRLT
jgi:hypothetical protein